MTIDEEITDFSAGLLIRYFRTGLMVNGGSPRTDYQRDVEILKAHWALSAPVRALTDYLIKHPHEAQSLLTFKTRIDDAIARGRINAIKTWQYRLQSGIASAIVAEEPVRSYETGPNFLLAWVLREASAFTGLLLGWQDPSSPYIEPIEQAQREMRNIQKIEALKDPMRAVSLGHRPGAGALRTALRARQRIYRLAADAYLLLQGLERGDPKAIDTVARTALLAPLEEWRRYELAVGLAVGEALATAAGVPLQLRLLGGDAAGPIMIAGRFAVHWQQRTTLYRPPELEPSEIITRTVLAAYGLSAGSDRPDLIITDRERDVVVSVVEVKYLAGDTANARFREAVDQIVRYARGYVPAGTDTRPLIAQSIVALSHGAPAPIDKAALAPLSIDFAGIRRNELASWADQMAAASLA